MTAGRRAEDPPPRAPSSHPSLAPSGDLSAAPTNLAPLATSFVGREAALGALAECLSRARLVTVLGPPGTGKTRLVKQHALSLLAGARAPAGGVFFCDLSEATTAFGVLARFAQVVSIDLGESLPLEDARRHVEAALRAHAPMLVLLDNYEQAVRSAASLLPDLLAAAHPETRFVVTSRERLGVPGESLFDLGPLALPGEGGAAESEAVLLFIERARAASQSFQPTEAELRDIAALVRLLDGLPLAIELAAARVRVLAPSELVERFGSRFGWLTHDPSVLPRRATLWETIDASWALLQPWEQAALSQVSAFRGGFGVAAAEGVLDLTAFEGAPPVLDVLQSLRDKSLLLPDEGDPSGRDVRQSLARDVRQSLARDVRQALPRDVRQALPREVRRSLARRFTLLGSIRDFGEARLDADGMRAVFERHARFFLQLGEGLSAKLEIEDDPDVRRALRLEHENFLAVHRRFLSPPGGPGDLRGASLRAALVLARSASAYPYAFSLEALDAALAVTGEADAGPLLVARGLEARGNLRRFVGQTRESVEDFERVLALATAAGDRALMASALSGLGNAATVRARWAEAGDLFERALALVTGADDPAPAKHVEYGSSAPLTQRSASRDIPRSASRDRRAEGRLLTMLAATWFNRDEPAKARAVLLQALDLQRETRDRAFEGMSVTSLGIVSLATASLSEARTHLAEGLSIHREVGARHWEGVTLSYLALAELDAGRLAESHALHEQALSLLAEINVRRAEGLALAGSAGVFLAEGRLSEARARYRRALDLARSMSPDHEGLFLGYLGAVAAQQDDTTSAGDLFEMASRALAPFSRPAFAAAVEACRGLLDLARARAAGPEERPAHHAQARARLEAAAAWSGRSAEVRRAERLLAKALGDVESESAAHAKNALVVGPNGVWFRPPRAKESVRLHRRRALARIVHHLAEERARSPGEAASIPHLVERGWPGERVLPEAGTERVYTAVATLRRLGMRKLLLQRDDGYLLDPEIPLVRSTSAT